MSGLEFVAFSNDGKVVILQNEKGEWVEVPITEQTAAVAPQPPRSESLQNLTPREIQSRIRAGSTAEDLAAMSDTPIERVMMFAPPILLERKHVADKASSSVVRRANGSGRLREVVSARLEPMGVNPADLNWDSYRREDGRWTILLSYPTVEGARVATWLYDAKNAALVPADDEARWLVGDPLPKSAPVTTSTEPTVSVPRLQVVRDTEEIDRAALVEPKADVTDVQEQELETLFDEPDVPVEVESDLTAPEPEPEPAPRRKLPTWDEILFGGADSDEE